MNTVRRLWNKVPTWSVACLAALVWTWIAYRYRANRDIDFFASLIMATLFWLAAIVAKKLNIRG